MNSAAARAAKAPAGSGQADVDAAKKAVEAAKKYLASEQWKGIKKTIQDAADAEKGLAKAKAEAEGSKASAAYAESTARSAILGDYEAGLKMARSPQ